MAAKHYSLDTNILFYSIDVRDPTKHTRSLQLIERASSQRLRIVLQSMGELCNSVAKRQPALRSQAQQTVRLLSEIYPVITAELEDLHKALAMQEQHKFQFWDAMLLCTAQRGGCHTLLSEDMHDGRNIDGITVRNPFKMTSDDFESFLD